MHLGHQCLDVASNAGKETADDDGHEQGDQSAVALPNDLITGRALTRDDQRVVERMDVRQTGRRDELLAMRLGGLIGVTVKLGLGSRGSRRPRP